MNNTAAGTFITHWKAADLSGRFEMLVALLLSVAISIVVVLAAVRVLIGLGLALMSESAFLDYKMYQTIFGMIMVVLIALEFNHIVVQIVKGAPAATQVKIVVVIAILAVVRKFIILDISDTPAETIFALAAAVLALGGVYWFTRERNKIIDRKEGGITSTSSM